MSLKLKFLIYPLVMVCFPAIGLYPLNAAIDEHPQYQLITELNSYIPLLAYTITGACLFGSYLGREVMHFTMVYL